jgi:hypothetical protein
MRYIHKSHTLQIVIQFHRKKIETCRDIDWNTAAQLQISNEHNPHKNSIFHSSQVRQTSTKLEECDLY